MTGVWRRSPTVRTYKDKSITRYRKGRFDGDISFRRQSKTAADIRPSSDGSAVRTSLVAGGGYASGSQRAYSLGSCATGQTDGRIALFQNAPYDGGIISKTKFKAKPNVSLPGYAPSRLRPLTSMHYYCLSLSLVTQMHYFFYCKLPPTRECHRKSVLWITPTTIGWQNTNFMQNDHPES